MGDRDELKALLALGIIASVGIIFQLKASHISIVAWSPANPAIKPLLSIAKDEILGAFSVYVVLLSFALGFEDIGRERLGERFELFANVIFVVGDATLLLAFVIYTIRIFWV